MMLPRKRRQEYGGDGFQKRRRETTRSPKKQSGGDPRNWTPQQVHDWILSVQTKSGEVFAKEFLENDINGGDMLDLDQDDFLQQFEHVTNAFAKKKLWRNVENLRKENPKRGGEPPKTSSQGAPQFPPAPIGNTGGAPPTHSTGVVQPAYGHRNNPPPRPHYREEPRRHEPFVPAAPHRPHRPPLAHESHAAVRPPWEKHGDRRSRGEHDHRDHGSRGGHGHRGHGSRVEPVYHTDQFTTGCVKSFLAAKGFGFISETDTLKDVYFHGSQFNGNTAHIKDGDLLRFRIQKVPKGWEANEITLLPAAVPKPRVAGFVTRTSSGGKCGDIFDNHGFEIFFFQKDTNDYLKPNHYVSFEVMNTKQQPRALRIIKLDVSRGYVTKTNEQGGSILDDYGLELSYTFEDVASNEVIQMDDYVEFEVEKRQGPHHIIRAKNVTTRVDPKHMPKPKNFAGTSRGIVQAFNEEKCFGFIKDLTNGETIFVHADHIVCEPKTLMKDDFVQFDVGMVKKGYKAFNCTKMQLPKPRGKITFFNEARGFGYIKERQGVDLFFHISNCEGRPKEPEQDDVVEFDIEGSQKGPEAVNVLWVEPDEELDCQPAPAQGDIKEMKPDHGFICQDAGGPDAYFLPTDMDADHPLSVGEHVQYAILPTGKGPKAFNIRLFRKKSRSAKPTIQDGPSHGKLKCFYHAKQIGFVTDRVGVDLFFRRSDFIGTNWDSDMTGAELTYTIVTDSKGPSAKDISRAEGGGDEYMGEENTNMFESKDDEEYEAGGHESTLV